MLMRFVLRRSFSIFQWEALLLLVAGVTVNQLNYCSKAAAGDIFSTAAVLYTLGTAGSGRAGGMPGWLAASRANPGGGCRVIVWALQQQ